MKTPYSIKKYTGDATIQTITVPKNAISLAIKGLNCAIYLYDDDKIDEFEVANGQVYILDSHNLSGDNVIYVSADIGDEYVVIFQILR